MTRCAASGLVYLINRYYDPQVGEFISVDPAVALTQQPYEYAGGNPVTSTDPTGRLWSSSCLNRFRFTWSYSWYNI